MDRNVLLDNTDKTHMHVESKKNRNTSNLLSANREKHPKNYTLRTELENLPCETRSRAFD